MRKKFTSRQRRLLAETTPGDGGLVGDVMGGLAKSMDGALEKNFDAHALKPDQYPGEAKILKMGLKDEYLKFSQSYGEAVMQGRVPGTDKNKPSVTPESFLKNIKWCRDWYAKETQQQSGVNTKVSASQTTQAMNSVYDNLRSMQQVFQGPLKNMWKEYERTLASVAKLKSAIDASINKKSG